jgi:hypothetical protein
MKKFYSTATSVRLDDEVKSWLYARMQSENRSLSNLINTILKNEKEREENPPCVLGDVKFNIDRGVLNNRVRPDDDMK